MNLPDHDSRSRDTVKSAYNIPTFNGSIVCVVGGLRLGDFYRSVPVMAETVNGSGSVQAVPGVRTGGSTPPTDAYESEILLPSGVKQWNRRHKEERNVKS